MALAAPPLAGFLIRYWVGMGGTTSAGSSRTSNQLIRQSRCGPVTRPVAPSVPIGAPRGSTSLSDWARHHPPQALTILIGPEGGFSDVEESTALAHGALCLTMGERILRTETAGLAALSIVQAHWS